MWQKIELQPMKTAPKDEMIMLDAGFGFLTVGHWNETEQCWVYAQMNCNDGDGRDMYFENEYEKTRQDGFRYLLLMFYNLSGFRLRTRNSKTLLA